MKCWSTSGRVDESVLVGRRLLD